jgi:hypothetical protein
MIPILEVILAQPCLAAKAARILESSLHFSPRVSKHFVKPNCVSMWKDGWHIRAFRWVSPSSIGLIMPNKRRLYHVPERYSFEEDTTLRAFLADNLAANVEISASNLRRIDSLFVQYLIAVAQFWAAKGLKFEVTGLQTELALAMKLLGVRPEILVWRAAK